MRLARLYIALILAYSIAAWGCEHAGPLETIDPGGNGGTVTFSDIQTSILDRHCAIPSCHVGAGAPWGLDLSEGEAYGNLVSVASGQMPALLRVKPGDPDSSYVVWKVEGDPRISGLQMPRGRDPLADAEMEAIRNWIADGAEDN